MTDISKLMAYGTQGNVAKELVVLSIDSNITAVGSVLSQAYSLVADVGVVGTTTSATADAVKLRDFSSPKGYHRTQYVINRGGAQVRVFCPTGGSMNGVSGGSFTLSSATHAQFVCLNPSTNDYVKL